MFFLSLHFNIYKSGLEDAGHQVEEIRKYNGDKSEKAPTSHDRVVLDRPSHNHDGVMQRTFRLFDKLLRPTSHDDGAGARPRAAREEVEPTRKMGYILRDFCKIMGFL